MVNIINCIMTTIGKIVKKVRLDKQLSQKGLANLIGVDVSFICKIEKDEKKVSLEKLESISKVLNIDYNNLKHIYYSDKINSVFINEEKEFVIQVLENIIQTYHV